MKKTLIISAFTFLCLILNAQDYTVSFSANGLGTQIDSVHIENVSQDKDTIVYGNDDLHLLGAVKVDQEKAENRGISVYPNPFSDKTKIEFYSENPESAVIRIYDLSGKTIYSKQINAVQGINNFTLSGLKSGNYIIKIKSAGIDYSQTISAFGNNENIDITNSAITENTPQLKTTRERASVAWQYNDDDVLIFTGYSGGHSRIEVFKITSDVAIPFNFILCEDVDGNKYTVRWLNGKEWMAENLKTTKLNNNVPIPELTDSASWAGATSPARCYFANDSAVYGEKYGALYNHAAAGSGNLCPTGWHVPTETEFEDLIVFLQNNGYNYNGYVDSDNDYSTNDYTAKSLCATSGWVYTDSVGAPGNDDYPDYRNRSGFSVLGASGLNSNIGYPTNLKRSTGFWTSTENGPDMAVRINFLYKRPSILIGNRDKTAGQSIRCVKN